MDRRVKAAGLFAGSWCLIGTSLAFASPGAIGVNPFAGAGGNVPQSTTGAWGEWKSPTTCSRTNGRVASDEQINLWITQAMEAGKKHGVKSTRAGYWKHIKDESGGNPYICNPDDINAINGVPSKGLVQVIGPTFRANHCDGTSDDNYDPVANLCAGALYATRRYGSFDAAPTPY